DRQQKMRQIQAEIRTLPLERQSLEGQLTASAEALAGLKHKAQHVEIDRKKLELDAGTRQQTIARLRTQQYETRKNDEFRAMGNEIERYEKEIRAIEDQELELMDQAEKLKVEVSAEEKKASSVRESIARQMSDLEEKGKALESRLEELSAERAE